MTKYKSEWADKRATKLLFGLDVEDEDKAIVEYWIARNLRAAERRGFMRAVKLLQHGEQGKEWSQGWSDWLEKQK